MSSVARFISEPDGFEARIDDETGEWVVLSVGHSPDSNRTDLNKSILSVRAPADADYTAERMENWWGGMSSVERPRNLLRMLRAKSLFPDGEVLIDYEPDGDEGKNLIY